LSWRDREYARPYSFGGSPFFGHRSRRFGGSLVIRLIIANVAVFVVTSLTGAPSDPLSSPVFEFLALQPSAVFHGAIWQLITAQYLHWSVGHLFVNMLGLYFFGGQLLQDWGPRRFFAVYTAAGLVGNLFYLAVTSVGWLSSHAVLAGASGCVLGLLGACAVRYPDQIVIVYFVPMRVRTLALLFAGLYILNLISRGENAGGDACHIAGMAFGALWAYRGEQWWGSRRFSMPSIRRRTRSTRPSRESPSSFQQRVEQRRTDDEAVDRILKKVYEGGIHSLTAAEKKTLHEATERQRAFDTGRS
jgi:membrane associated rhomboid family serine protease